ncbi:MAG TPA: glutaredoxin domain-containing protein, partial [Dokdonella sp.]|nr:glutaredoxin domain-containing protein [Dokdonella sp.]
MYGLKNCDTCKKARNWLDRHAVEYRFIDYREQPATPEQLKRWAEAA